MDENCIEEGPRIVFGCRMLIRVMNIMLRVLYLYDEKFF